MKFLAVLVVTLLAGSVARAQSDHPVAAQAEYTWAHTNVLPGCNCFGMQGGSGELLFGLSPRFDAVVDVTATHRGGLTPSGYALTQGVFTAGVKYEALRRSARVGAFGEVLLGAAHASGTLAPSYGGFGGDTAFALQAGGGLRVRLSERWSVVPVHVDYLMTTFANGSANRQNQLRLSGGVQFRLRR